MTEQASARSKRRYARTKNSKAAPTTRSASEKAPFPPRETKIGKVIALLQRDEGTTLDEIVQATGWQPHSARAALTGLKKKGHVIEKDKRDDRTCYRIPAPA